MGKATKSGRAGGESVKRPDASATTGPGVSGEEVAAPVAEVAVKPATSPAAPPSVETVSAPASTAMEASAADDLAAAIDVLVERHGLSTLELARLLLAEQDACLVAMDEAAAAAQAAAAQPDPAP